MGYSEAARAGIRQNGKRWKATIRGIPDALEVADAAISAEDVPAINASLRTIGKLFSPHIKENKASFGEMEALEWFQEETCDYEAEQGMLHEFRQEFDFRLGELYDYADFHRIWVAPERTAKDPEPVEAP